MLTPSIFDSQSKGRMVLFFSILCFVYYYPLSGAVKAYPRPAKINDWAFEPMTNPGNSDILYSGNAGKVKLYVSKHGLIFKIRTPDANRDVSEASGLSVTTNSKNEERTISVDFMNGSQNVIINPEAMQPYYSNYFNAKGNATKVSCYKKLVLHEVYPKIDMVLIPRENGLKYEFIVRPGGKTSDITLDWKGLSGMNVLADGSLGYQTGNKGFVESSPYCYTREDSSSVSASFSKTGNSVRFKTGNYRKNKTLVIDPVISWATYYGGSAYDNANAVSTDLAGNVYLVGETSSSSNIASSGAFKTSISGGISAFIVKFNSKGARLWATYYMDAGKAKSCQTDKYGNIFIAGSTGSANGVATTGAYQSSLNGSSDAFIAKFSASGFLQWGTYFGGEQDEQANAITIDVAGDIFITGITNSSSGISTKGAYQTSMTGGTDAFVARFDTAGSLKWATYFGGLADDEATTIATDSKNNVIIAGNTKSDSGIASTNAWQKKYGGNEDGFASKFNRLGKLIWSSYYGGSQYDVSSCISFDSKNGFYLCGTTASSSSISTSGSYMSVLRGNANAYILYCDSSGTKKWGTYFGEYANSAITSCLVDGENNLYIMGRTDANIPVTPNAFQKNYGGGNLLNNSGDAFIAKFSDSVTLAFSTMYGGSNTDQGTALAKDTAGNVYMCGNTVSTNGIAKSGGYQLYKGGSYYDAFLIKFGGLAGPTPMFKSKDSLCNKNIYTFTTINYPGHRYLWKTSGGSIINGQKTNSVQIKMVSVGAATITVIETNKNGLQDSFTAKPTVFASPVAVIKGNTTTCRWPANYYTTTKDSTVKYTWFVKGGTVIFGQNTDSIIVSWDSTGKGIVKLTATNASGCRDSVTDSIVIKSPKANAGADRTLCFGNSTQIGSAPIKGHKYRWVDIVHNNVSVALVSNPIIKITHPIYWLLMETDSGTGCTDVDTISVKVNPAPQTALTGDTMICTNGTGHYRTTFTNGAALTWTVKNGIIISLSKNKDSIAVQWAGAGIGFVQVKGILGPCSDSSFLNISIGKPSPKIAGSFNICGLQSETYKANNMLGYIYNWIINGGLILNGQSTASVNVQWKDTTTGKLTLTETSLPGCSSTLVAIITIKMMGLNFSFNDVCLSDSARIKDSSTKVKNYLWDFGDGGTSIITNPVHLYNSPQLYNINLKATNSNSCTAELKKSIQVFPTPFAGFVLTHITNYKFNFRADDTLETTYSWLIDSKPVSDKPHFQFDFTKAGDYVIKLSIKNNNECSTVKDTTIHIDKTGIARQKEPSNEFRIYPNPGSLPVTVSYYLAEKSKVSLELYNIMGAKIESAINNETQLAGEQSVILNYSVGSHIKAGLYFVRLIINDTAMNKLLIVQ